MIILCIVIWCIGIIPAYAMLAKSFIAGWPGSELDNEDRCLLMLLAVILSWLLVGWISLWGLIERLLFAAAPIGRCIVKCLQKLESL